MKIEATEDYVKINDINVELMNDEELNNLHYLFENITDFIGFIIDNKKDISNKKMYLSQSFIDK